MDRSLFPDFENCSALTSINLPSSITEIKRCAFLSWKIVFKLLNLLFPADNILFHAYFRIGWTCRKGTENIRLRQLSNKKPVAISSFHWDYDRFPAFGATRMNRKILRNGTFPWSPTWAKGTCHSRAIGDSTVQPEAPQRNDIAETRFDVVLHDIGIVKAFSTERRNPSLRDNSSQKHPSLRDIFG